MLIDDPLCEIVEDHSLPTQSTSTRARGVSPGNLGPGNPALRSSALVSRKSIAQRPVPWWAGKCTRDSASNLGYTPAIARL